MHEWAHLLDNFQYNSLLVRSSLSMPWDFLHKNLFFPTVYILDNKTILQAILLN